jgi:hypothetical protein
VFVVLVKSHDRFSSYNQVPLPAWYENVMMLEFEPLFFVFTKAICFANRPVDSRYKPVHSVTDVAVKLAHLQRTAVYCCKAIVF